MAKLLKLRGGTTSQHGSFTGSDREVTVDTDKETLVVHDGSTAGGFPLARADGTGSSNFTITGELDCATLDVSGNADIDGTLEADAMTLNGTAITTTATLSTGISNNNVLVANAGVADNDFLQVNGTKIEGRTASELASDIGGSIVTTGALNSGSITSGFGAINNGSSNITTSGVGTFGSLDISGNIDVDGTTNLDNTDIDGTLNVQGETTLQTHLNMGDNDKIKLGASGDLELYHDGSNSYLDDTGTGGLFIRVDDALYIRSTGNENMIYAQKDGDVRLYHNNSQKLNTSSGGISVSGTVTASGDITAFSDRRLKTDITNIDNALSKVMQMQGVNYKRNDIENAPQSIGVIAQDMEAILPEVIHTSDDEMQTKSVDYGKITSVLIEAIKELKAEINELKGR